MWNSCRNDGTMYKLLETESYVTELIIQHKNIHLFSFNCRTDRTTDLNNYKDSLHYASWINSLILKWMRYGHYRLTEENYKDRLKEEFDFYTTFDYESIKNQVDYEADCYAGALLNKELTGIDPLDVLNDEKVRVSISGAEYIKDDDGRNSAVECHGLFNRNRNEGSLEDYIRDREYIGIRFDVNLDEGFNYLCFYGQKVSGQGCLTAYVFDEEGNPVGHTEAEYEESDNEVHQYAIDLSGVDGKVTVVLNGVCTDSEGSPDSGYRFSEVFMY